MNPRVFAWSGVLAIAVVGCLLKPTLVSITPDYAYVDGCEAVMIQGHHLGTKASGSIGGDAFLEIAPPEKNPDAPEHAQELGFLFNAVVPPAPGGEPGFYDVALTVDGEKLSIYKGFYYRACPATFLVEAIDYPTPAPVGSSITLSGCGFSAEVTASFVDTTSGTEVATAPLVSDCSTAQVHLVVPSLADGEYELRLAHTDGTTYAGNCFYESGDTGVTCSPTIVEVGGSR